MAIFRKREEYRIGVVTAADIVPVLEESGLNVDATDPMRLVVGMSNDTSKYLLSIHDTATSIKFGTELATFKTGPQNREQVGQLTNDLLHENARLEYSKLSLEFDEEKSRERILLTREIPKKTAHRGQVLNEIANFDSAVEYLYPEVLRQADIHAVVIDRSVKEIVPASAEPVGDSLLRIDPLQ